MGKYINGIGLTYQEKVRNLISRHHAMVTNSVFQPDLVCVADNGPFAAAAYCYDENEFNRFRMAGDDRPKTWLIVPNAEKLID